MTHDERLQAHLALCKRMYERMKRDDSWPWRELADSPKSENLVESGSDKNEP